MVQPTLRVSGPIGRGKLILFAGNDFLDPSPKGYDLLIWEISAC